MKSLNNVPSQGTFGGAIQKINENFQLVQEVIGEISDLLTLDVGYFSTSSDLEASYPTPVLGMSAVVGDQFEIYKCTTAGTWTATGDRTRFNSAIVTSRPSTPDPHTIYCVQGIDSWTEEVYSNGSWVILATHSGALIMDATPTGGSANPVQSGGVFPMYAEMFGANAYVDVEKLGTIDTYMSVANAGGYANSTSYYTNIYPIEQGGKYEISVPLAGNSAMYTLGYTDYATLMAKSYYQDAHVFEFTDTIGTNKPFTYTIDSAGNYPCLMISYKVSGGEPVVKKYAAIAPVVVKTEQQNFSDIEKAQARGNIGAANVSVEQDVVSIKGDLHYTEEKDVNWVENMMAQQTNFRRVDGKRTTLPILLYKGETVAITTAGDSSYVLYPIVQVSGGDAIIGNSSPCIGLVQRTAPSSDIFTYSYTATEDIWICLSGTTDCTYSFINLKEESTIKRLENEIAIIAPLLKHSRIMFFGASNTAQSSAGVVGFAQLIAESAGLPYRSFVYDSADGNTADVIYAKPNITNYAKDGTCLRVISGRTDGVVARIKRHITENDYPDYVVLGFPANDAASQYTNMGTMSDSYTATFDTDTQLGALEEVCRYVTELGKPIKFGCFIPWEITWVASNFYDAYIPVLQKWCVPYLDLRRTAGFDLKNCAAHRNLYSLTADDYATWSATTTYNLDDKVKYGGSLYKCNADGVVGIEPTNTTYWMLVSSTSADGTHLNSIGSKIVMGKIRTFIESL